MTHREALAYVETHHRHSVPPRGMVFAVGAGVGESLEGVAIVGRPVARGLQDGWTLEVLRLCTPSGRRNATCARSSTPLRGGRRGLSATVGL
jgi:hypothetical protein